MNPLEQMIDFSINPEAYGEITVEEARKHQELIDQLNYLAEEGMIDVEESEDGQIRLYATEGV